MKPGARREYVQGCAMCGALFPLCQRALCWGHWIEWKRGMQ